MLQPCFKSFFKIGQNDQREDQKHQELPKKLAQDDEGSHHRVVPAVVGTVSRRGDGFCRPLDALQEGARRTFQMVHSDHVNQGQNEYGRGQKAQERQKTLVGTVEFELHVVKPDDQSAFYRLFHFYSGDDNNRGQGSRARD